MSSLLQLQFEGFRITSLAHAKPLLKINFRHKFFISEPIFKIFAAFFKGMAVPAQYDGSLFVFSSPQFPQTSHRAIQF